MLHSKKFFTSEELLGFQFYFYKYWITRLFNLWIFSIKNITLKY